MSVAHNVGYGVEAPDRSTRVDKVLAMVRLTGMGSRMANELSGGEQQRVALARAALASLDDCSMAPERPDGALLVRLDQSAVSGDVGRKDGRQHALAAQSASGHRRNA